MQSDANTVATCCYSNCDSGISNVLLIEIDFSAQVVYLREDEWLIIQKMFVVDVELRRETIVDDDGRRNVVLVPGTAALFL